MAAASPDPGPYAQELLHLAAASSARARLHAQSDHPGIRIRLATPGDLPRLNELCTIGATRCGLPPAARISQLNADFDLARPSLVVALADDGSITGFSYSVDLNSSTWQAAARSRGTYFDTLPAAELAAIKAAPAGSFGAGLWTGITHLPGHDHVGAALSEGLPGRRVGVHLRRTGHRRVGHRRPERRHTGLPSPDPRPRRQGTSSPSTAESQPRGRRTP